MMYNPNSMRYAVMGDSYTAKSYRALRCGYCANLLKLERFFDPVSGDMDWMHIDDSDGSVYPCAVAEEVIEEMRRDVEEMKYARMIEYERQITKARLDQLRYAVNPMLMWKNGEIRPMTEEELYKYGKTGTHH